MMKRFPRLSIGMCAPFAAVAIFADLIGFVGMMEKWIRVTRLSWTESNAAFPVKYACSVPLDAI